MNQKESKSKVYVAPDVQVIDMVLEGSILSGSGTDGGSLPGGMPGEDW